MTEMNIRSAGTMTQLNARRTAALIGLLRLRFKGYPTNSLAYEVEGFKLVIPMVEAPCSFDTCGWSTVTDVHTGQPLALVPNAKVSDMENLRRDMRLFCKYPIAIFHNGLVFYDELNYAYSVGCGWFPLTHNVESCLDWDDIANYGDDDNTEED